MATCLDTTITGQSIFQLPYNCETSRAAESESYHNPKYPTTGIIYTELEWRRIPSVKVWIPNAMQSGDLIWGAQITILGYALVLLGLVLEWVLRR